MNAKVTPIPENSYYNDSIELEWKEVSDGHWALSGEAVKRYGIYEIVRCRRYDKSGKFLDEWWKLYDAKGTTCCEDARLDGVIARASDFIHPDA